MASLRLARSTAFFLIAMLLLSVVAPGTASAAAAGTTTTANQASQILLDGAPLHGRTIAGGKVTVELDTDVAVDGVRFRVDGEAGPFVRPQKGRITAEVTVDGDGLHTVSAELFRRRKTVETVNATFTVGSPPAAMLLTDDAPLHGVTFPGGTLAVELHTDLKVDGVRFRVDGEDGPFARPVDGVINAELVVEGDGQHTVSAHLFRDRKTVGSASATIMVGEPEVAPAPAVEPAPEPQAAATLVADGAALDGMVFPGGSLAVELRTELAVDGVRFRVDGHDGPFVRPADGIIATEVTIDGDGVHTVTAQLFRDRKNVETAEAAVIVGESQVAPMPEPEPTPEAEPEPTPEAELEPSAVITYGAGPLDGAVVAEGPMAITLDTELVLDGVRFRVNGNDGVFVRPVDGVIAAEVEVLGEGQHTVSAHLFRNRQNFETVEARLTVANPSSPAPGAESGADGGSVDRGERLGLHVTEAELETWRQRTANGPYKTRGDESANSPGDWDRIVSNAQGFKNNPDASFWRGAVANNPGGCLVRDGGKGSDPRYSPPMEPADRLRDAAFYAMVRDDAAYADVVKDLLLRQAVVDELDFTNTKRYCTGVLLDVGPSFEFATWLNKLLFAADYLEVRDPNAFTASQRKRLDAWFAAAATWMKGDIDIKLNELFVDREADDFRLTARGRGDSKGDRITYLGGPEAKTLHRRFNNRNARMARFVGIVGVDQGNAEFIRTGKDYVEDSIRFGYFPEGATGDFERWTSSMPIKGWKYANEWAGALVSIADHLSRAGDDSLYQFSTTEGALGTEGRHHSGAPKSLHTLIADLYGYVDGTHVRYGTDRDSQRTGEYRIDSVDEKANDHRVSDTMLIMANRYYQDDYLKSVYTRTAKGAPGYPQKPGSGMGDPWSGEHGLYPGMLFMFGQTEHIWD